MISDEIDISIERKIELFFDPDLEAGDNTSTRPYAMSSLLFYSYKDTQFLSDFYCRLANISL